jgi:hypothetical protein
MHGRADVIIDPESATPNTTEHVHIKGPAEAMTLGLQWIKRALKTGNVLRVAVVVSRSVQVADAPEAITIIKGIVPELSVAPNAVDLWYQTNVPLPSKVVKKATINRLCRWNTGARIGFLFDPTTPQPPTLSKQILAAEQFDINTSDTASIGQQRMPPMFDELSAVVTDLMEHQFNALL